LKLWQPHKTAVGHALSTSILHLTYTVQSNTTLATHHAHTVPKPARTRLACDYRSGAHLKLKPSDAVYHTHFQCGPATKAHCSKQSPCQWSKPLSHSSCNGGELVHILFLGAISRCISRCVSVPSNARVLWQPFHAYRKVNGALGDHTMTSNHHCASPGPPGPTCRFLHRSPCSAMTLVASKFVFRNSTLYCAMHV
jgi:hypothetical protein